METELQGFLKRPVASMPRRTALLLAVFAAALAGLGSCSATAARADGIVLCNGYAACSAGSYTTNGYGAAARTSWWRMYPGVNCTNYAAYVESQIFGVPTPDYLLGNAGQWSANAAANGVSVNHTPTVGAVAVWRSGTPGVGKSGHVAIVEAVGPNDSYIEVSQDDISTAVNGYDWEQIYPGGTSTAWQPWPSSFIHFAPAPTPAPAASRAALPDVGSGPPMPRWPWLDPGSAVGFAGVSAPPLQAAGGHDAALQLFGIRQLLQGPAAVRASWPAA